MQRALFVLALASVAVVSTDSSWLTSRLLGSEPKRGGPPARTARSPLARTGSYEDTAVARAETHCGLFEAEQDNLCSSGRKDDLALLAVLMANCHREQLGAKEPLLPLSVIRRRSAAEDHLALQLMGRLPVFCSTVKVLEERLQSMTGRQYNLLNEAVETIRELTKDKDKDDESERAYLAEIKKMQEQTEKATGRAEKMDKKLEEMAKQITEAAAEAATKTPDPVMPERIAKLTIAFDATVAELKKTKEEIKEMEKKEDEVLDRMEALRRMPTVNQSLQQYFPLLFLLTAFFIVTRQWSLTEIVIAVAIFVYCMKSFSMPKFNPASIFSKLEQKSASFVPSVEHWIFKLATGQVLRLLLGNPYVQAFILVCALSTLLLLMLCCGRRKRAPARTAAVAAAAAVAQTFREPGTPRPGNFDVHNTAEVLAFLNDTRKQVEAVQSELDVISRRIQYSVSLGLAQKEASFSRFARQRVIPPPRRETRTTSRQNSIARRRPIQRTSEVVEESDDSEHDDSVSSQPEAQDTESDSSDSEFDRIDLQDDGDRAAQGGEEHEQREDEETPDEESDADVENTSGSTASRTASRTTSSSSRASHRYLLRRLRR